MFKDQCNYILRSMYNNRMYYTNNYLDDEKPKFSDELGDHHHMFYFS